ncbi:hypothetical protein SADUNF_Sadunf06G0108400 [Salix dunnii]|uniref:Pentatricopeptide repeat protein n=1 Tax=Salix dunnii TaxID=1413687 RepID=A0A835MWW9_9ROSI|nr:hypothetical protein SADUNF_Sadunf06G0108400 [Salix dunnii]
MEIIEDSGAVPDVITSNVFISGYCKAGEIDNASRAGELLFLISMRKQRRNARGNSEASSLKNTVLPSCSD